MWRILKEMGSVGDAIGVATNKGQCNCTSPDIFGLLMCHGLRSGLVGGLRHQHGSVDGLCMCRTSIVWEKIGLLTGGTKLWKNGMSLLPW